MRKLKFRVWDVGGDFPPRMSDPFNAYDTLIVFRRPQHDAIPLPFAADLERFRWMQFTGLRDRHGKEIYEGDIVSIDYNGLGNVVVAFVNAGFNIGAYRTEQSHIVGNIYETPKLATTSA